MAIQPGIYKTTKFLPGHEAEIAPSMLVLIRTDADFAPASVLLPVANENNQWKFAMPGIKVPPTAMHWLDSLEKIPHEGFYRLLEDITFGDIDKKTGQPEGRWVKNAIIQLGYTRLGEPIFFIAQRRSPLASNDLWFSDKGMKVEPTWFSKIEALSWFQEPDRKVN